MTEKKSFTGRLKYRNQERRDGKLITNTPTDGPLKLMNKRPNYLSMLNDIRKKVCVYAILYRNAGVAIQYALKKEIKPDNEYGLIVYRYYATLEGAIAAEYKRMIKNAGYIEAIAEKANASDSRRK